MKNLSYILGLAVSLVLLANCKIKVSGDVVTVEDDDQIKKQYYVGDLDSISYSDGGWYGLPNTPNYRLKLDLIVENSGLIRGTVDAPDCKTVGSVDVEIFAKLERLVKNSRTYIHNGPFFVDGGDEKITLTEDAIDQTTFLKQGDSSQNQPVMVEQDAQAVRSLVNSIAEQIKARGAGCATPSDIANVSMEQSGTMIFAAYMGETVPDMYNTPADSTIKRRMNVSFANGAAIVNIEESIQHNTGTAGCARSVKNQKVDYNEFLLRAQLIEYSTQQVICLMAEAISGAISTKVTSTYADGLQQFGWDGCYNNDRVMNHNKLLGELMALLEQQPKVCWVTTNNGTTTNQ